MNILFLQGVAPAAAPAGGGWISILFWGLAFAVIYFFMIRPQGQARKKQEEFKAMLKKGTKVVTISGLHGVILDMDDKTVDLMIAPKVSVTIQRDCISMEYTKAVNATYNDEKTETADKTEPATDKKNEPTADKKQPNSKNAAVQPDSEKQPS